MVVQWLRQPVRMLMAELHWGEGMAGVEWGASQTRQIVTPGWEPAEAEVAPC
jgi:hypothetical protein